MISVETVYDMLFSPLPHRERAEAMQLVHH
jgi:hypothetical protein